MCGEETRASFLPCEDVVADGEFTVRRRRIPLVMEECTPSDAGCPHVRESSQNRALVQAMSFDAVADLVLRALAVEAAARRDDVGCEIFREQVLPRKLREPPVVVRFVVFFVEE